jgi:hypothetical protein
MALTFAPWKNTGPHPSRVVAQVEAWRDAHTAVVIQPAWYDLTYAWAVDPKLFKGAAPLNLTLREANVYPVPGASLPPLDSTITTVVHIDAWASLTDPRADVLQELRRTYVQADSAGADKKVMMRLFRRR